MLIKQLFQSLYTAFTAYTANYKAGIVSKAKEQHQRHQASKVQSDKTHIAGACHDTTRYTAHTLDSYQPITCTRFLLIYFKYHRSYDIILHYTMRG